MAIPIPIIEEDVTCVNGTGSPKIELIPTSSALVLDISIPSAFSKRIIFLPFVSSTRFPSSIAPSATNAPPSNIPVVTLIIPAPTRGPTAFATLFIPAENASKNPANTRRIVNIE